MRIIFSSLILLVLALVGPRSSAQDNNRPNILFILIDDFGWKDVGFNGSTFYETPRMDEMADEWMRFDQFYTPSPMCSPTRTSILIGKNPARHGITQYLRGSDRAFGREGEEPRVYCPISQSPGVEESEVTLGEALRDAGYDTAFYGKWHLGPFEITGGPANHGYDSQRAVIEANRCEMFYPFRGVNYFPEAKEGDNFTDLLTDAAIEYLTADHDKPFYLHLAYFAMHAPIGSKPELRARFEKKRQALPILEIDRKMGSHSHAPQKVRQDNPEYAGELYNLDANVGRLIDALKARGLYDNTIIIFTGDNGGRTSYWQDHPTSNRPLRTGKTFIFDGGLRTPTLIHWPGHTGSGMRTQVPATSMDFYPTLLDMLGLPLKPEQHIDGVSLVPLIEGEAIKRDALYWHFPHYQGEGSYPASAIRVGDYKLIHNYHHNDVLLFNLASDPNETTDLVPSMPRKASELDAKLMGYLKEVGAYIPQPAVGGR